MAPYADQRHSYGGSNPQMELEESIKALGEWTNVLTVLVVILCICAFIMFCLQLFKLITATVNVISPEVYTKKKRKSSKGSAKHKVKKSKSHSCSSKKVKGKDKRPTSITGSSSQVKSTDKTSERAPAPAKLNNQSTQPSVKLPPPDALATPAIPASGSAAVPVAASTTETSKSEKVNNVPTPATNPDSSPKNAKLQALNDKKLIGPVEGSGV